MGLRGVQLAGAHPVGVVVVDALGAALQGRCVLLDQQHGAACGQCCQCDARAHGAGAEHGHRVRWTGRCALQFGQPGAVALGKELVPQRAGFAAQAQALEHFALLAQAFVDGQRGGGPHGGNGRGHRWAALTRLECGLGGSFDGRSVGLRYG